MATILPEISSPHSAWPSGPLYLHTLILVALSAREMNVLISLFTFATTRH